MDRLRQTGEVADDALPALPVDQPVPSCQHPQVLKEPMGRAGIGQDAVPTLGEAVVDLDLPLGPDHPFALHELHPNGIRTLSPPVLIGSLAALPTAIDARSTRRRGRWHRAAASRAPDKRLNLLAGHPRGTVPTGASELIAHATQVHTFRHRRNHPHLALPEVWGRR